MFTCLVVVVGGSAILNICSRPVSMGLNHHHRYHHQHQQQQQRHRSIIVTTLG